MSIEVVVPVMGENIKEGQIVHVAAKEGENVKVGQAILEIETGKATVEVPSPASGKIEKILVKTGDRVDVGQLVILLEGAQVVETPEPKAQPHLLGVVQKAEQENIKLPVEAVKGNPASEKILAVATSSENIFREASDVVPVAAAPSVRRFARELGVRISEVPSSDSKGRIGIDDVKAYVKRLHSDQKSGAAMRVGNIVLPDFSKFGTVRVEPMSTIRLRTAEHMSLAWQTIPHVTQNAKARADQLESLRKKLGGKLEKEGTRLTLTAFLVKIVALNLLKYPKFNASIDMVNKKVVFKDFVNVGVAVDTEKGLLVPVVRDAHIKSIPQIARDLTAISEKARTGKLSPDDMSGGTFTVSNLGSIGGGHFTPIVNAPEVAILGVSRAVAECVPGAQGEPVFSSMLPLSLSYDHRLIDGAEGARFVISLVETIEDPSLLLLN